MIDARALFEPTLAAYLAYVAEFCVRYFGFVGGLYWVFHVGFRRRWLAHRIQRTFPDRASIRHEIWWSMTNTATTAASTVFTYHLIQRGMTSMYFTVADWGWTYLAASAALCVLGYDTWLYWQHRLLHTRWLFQHVHWVHHRVGNPTPFATFAMHPVETFMGNVFFILFTVFVPVHPFAMAAAGAYMFAYGTICHLGYELYPRWFARAPLLRHFNNATYHNMHHSLIRCNYGNWFIFWDRLMGTDHRAYEDTWDAVMTRRTTAAESAPATQAA
jgi:sterol desaturase/sphingolipid hydroxylase (fatty acid hydroxylase superfamily)